MENQAEPFVSVVLPCYNHAEFVGRAIESVLHQRYQNYELLIADDGSTDDSVSVIKQYEDSRIVFAPIEKNTGFSACLYLYAHAKGKYIAAISSDDMWKPSFLEKSISFLERHGEYGCTFCIPEVIDAQDRVLSGEGLKKLFRGGGEVRTQEEWFRELYMFGNCICAPTMCIRRKVYERFAPFRYQYRQFQDYDFWLRMLPDYNIYVMPEKLSYYRIHMEGENHNISKDDPDVRMREKMEKKYIMLSVMEDLDDDFFLRAFADYLIKKPGEEGFCVECEKFSVMLNSEAVPPESAALYFYHHYNEERFQTCIEKHYGITRKDFWKFSGGDYDGTLRQEQEIERLQQIIIQLQEIIVQLRQATK